MCIFLLLFYRKDQIRSNGNEQKKIDEKMKIFQRIQKKNETFVYAFSEF